MGNAASGSSHSSPNRRPKQLPKSQPKQPPKYPPRQLPKHPPKKKLQKEDEFPGIDWRNLFDRKIQLATVLYNDRVNTWREMKVLDAQLDSAPTARKVAQMAELRIRNLQCFSELQSLNDTGDFLYEHPLVAGQGELAVLESLFKTDATEFLRQYQSCADNIRRYRSYLKRSDRADRREQDKSSLARWLRREQLFRQILSQHK